ncbi:hypothetical protein BDN72DRAFT_225444 [Pluteus cervinus]|uniref:Uncharacterized protein n=1 Tax=Pluteus cervinus TaxID=181527 RepID=A0ACD3BEY8_9AGAR|nr:hypothetical protein BDN72DRAFT_225444 [Pluteus cervinus]
MLAESSSPIERLSEALGLSELPSHFATVVASFLGFLFIHQVIAPFLSRKLFPVAYGEKLKGRLGKNTWAIHVVSQIHILIVVPLALWNISQEPEGHLSVREKAYLWTDASGTLHGIISGYFLWDSLDAIVHTIDVGFVAHGISCFLVYFLSFRPFLAYVGRRFILWETSTFFLNIHWFLDKTGRTGTTFQLVNGFILLATFFGIRIVYGSMISLELYSILSEVKDEVPPVYLLVYGVGNGLLQCLNWFWFSKMIAALRKRFEKTEQTANGAPSGEHQRLLGWQ